MQLQDHPKEYDSSWDPCLMRDEKVSEDHRASDPKNAVSVTGQRNITEGACLHLIQASAVLALHEAAELYFNTINGRYQSLCNTHEVGNYIAQGHAAS